MTAYYFISRCLTCRMKYLMQLCNILPYIVFVSRWKNIMVFMDHSVTAKVFPWKFLSSMLNMGSVTSNQNSFSGNEREDIKPQNFFTMH